MPSAAQMAGVTRPFVFKDLTGWEAEDHTSAWSVYSDEPVNNARYHIERSFDVTSVDVHFTGYYEPEFAASLVPTVQYPTPIYRMVDGLNATRADIERHNLLAGHEIAWLDRLDAFFLQVQGSGRLQLPSGPLRVGYAGRNGHPYVSIGKSLVARGEISAEDISAQAIRDWCAANPADVQSLLWENPSFVCFKLLDLAAGLGPLGSQGVPLTPLKSVAADPAVIPLGALLWLETAVHSGLAVAQDTGSAIIGARIDLYCGTGAKAGEMAGSLNSPGRAFVFTPKAAP